MSDTKTVVSSGGAGVFTLTFLILMVLKLTGLAEITWFWVFFPLWIPFAVVGGILLTGLVGVGLFFGTVWIADAINDWRRRRKRR